MTAQPEPTGDTLDPWLDLGIARAVRLLTEHGEPLGIKPFESCDASPGHCYDQPTVRFHGGYSAGWHALAICQAWRLPVSEISRLWQINDGEVCGPYWQLIFRRSVTEGKVTPPMEGWYGVKTDG